MSRNQREGYYTGIRRQNNGYRLRNKDFQFSLRFHFNMGRTGPKPRQPLAPCRSLAPVRPNIEGN